MKKSALLLGTLLGSITFAQVTTITPEIKGSGGLSIDPEGNLYIGDFGDYLGMADDDGLLNKVYKLDPEGNLTVYAEGFIGASGNAFNSEGFLYQADIRASVIYKIVDGTPEVFATVNITNPVGLVFDEDDNLYVCNCGSNTIAKITPEGESSIYSNDALFSCPNGITIDHEGILYVSNFNNGRVIKIEDPEDPTLLTTIVGGNNGHLRYCPVDSNLYVCSHGSSSIYKVNLDGETSWVAGTGDRGNDDGPWDEATFSRPNGIVFTAGGDTLYVNSSIPITDVDYPLNPSVIRQVSGIKTGVLKIEEVKANWGGIDIYPNPTTDNFVYISTPEEGELKLYNSTGSLVSTKFLQAGSLKLDLFNLPIGVYTLTFQLKSGNVEYRKLVKAR